jgi:phage shock protein A
VTTPTTHQVIKRLADLSRMLDAATMEIATLDEAAVRAKAAYEVKFARSFLESVGAMDVRKQQAVLDSADQKFGAELAEQKVRACRERIRTLRDQIDIGRSLNSAVRAEFAASAVGQT